MLLLWPVSAALLQCGGAEPEVGSCAQHCDSVVQQDDNDEEVRQTQGVNALSCAQLQAVGSAGLPTLWLLATLRQV